MPLLNPIGTGGIKAYEGFAFIKPSCSDFCFSPSRPDDLYGGKVGLWMLSMSGMVDGSLSPDDWLASWAFWMPEV